MSLSESSDQDTCTFESTVESTSLWSSIKRRRKWWSKHILTLISFSALLMAVFSGFFLGRLYAWDVPLLVIFVPVLFGVILIISELFESDNRTIPLRHKSFLVALAVGYITLLVILDPFMNVSSSLDCIRAVSLLVPLVGGFVYFFHRGCYYAASGLWLILFASVAILGFNVSHWHSGVGFLSRWIA